MTTIVAVVVGLLLTAATVTGIVKSVSDTHHRALPADPTANVQLYGSR
jgi:hypothetical protein